MCLEMLNIWVESQIFIIYKASGVVEGDVLSGGSWVEVLRICLLPCHWSPLLQLQLSYVAHVALHNTFYNVLCIIMYYCFFMSPKTEFRIFFSV